MPPIISAQGLSKKYGATPLFKDISFTVSSGECIGVIGPNGSGKSTLLEILAGRVKPDTGDVAVRKGTRLSCVTQISDFAAGDTVLSVVEKALETLRRAAIGKSRAHRGNAGPRGIHGSRYRGRDAFRRMAQAPGDRRSAGTASGYSAARRTDQSSGSGGNRVAGRAAAQRRVCVRGGKPRPLFSGKRGHRNGGAEQAVRRRLAAREWKLQHVSGGQGAVPARATERASGAGQPCTHGNRMAAAWPEGAHDEIQSANR